MVGITNEQYYRDLVWKLKNEKLALEQQIATLTAENSRLLDGRSKDFQIFTTNADYRDATAHWYMKYEEVTAENLRLTSLYESLTAERECMKNCQNCDHWETSQGISFLPP